MPSTAAQFRFLVYDADDLTVVNGANLGDTIGLADEVVAGDQYRLHRAAKPRSLAIRDGVGGGQVIADGSEIGQTGDPVVLNLCHVLMAPDGTMTELLLLSVSGDAGETRHVLPLGTLQILVEYDLVATEIETAPRRFADIASVSFLAGTHLTMADGAQRRVEELKVGDRLLTRLHGAQPIRWIGQQTLRASGAMAPIRIAKGTLNTSRDLVLSPHHRLFVWQRSDELGTGRAEVMVQASLLVNGETVTREESGFVEAYHIVFAEHEIIFAEGIAVESLLVTDQTRAALPPDLELPPPEAGGLNAAALEVEQDALGDGEDAAEKLARASRGKS